MDATYIDIPDLRSIERRLAAIHAERQALMVLRRAAKAAERARGSQESQDLTKTKSASETQRR